MFISRKIWLTAWLAFAPVVGQAKLALTTIDQSFFSNENNVDSYIFFMHEDFKDSADEGILNNFTEKDLATLKASFDRNKFKAKKDQLYVLNGGNSEFIFAGLGSLQEAPDKNLECLRRAIGKSILTLKQRSLTRTVIILPFEQPYGIGRNELYKQMGTIATLADYDFKEMFKVADGQRWTNKADNEEWNGSLFFFDAFAQNVSDIDASLRVGRMMGSMINDARYWIDLPGNIMTPTRLAQEAQKVSQEGGLQYTVFGRERAAELGMGAFLAVDEGSDQPGKFVVLEYHPADVGVEVPTIALVGKGVTFDTGGISLKMNPNDMKFDMGGAAAVIGTMRLIAQLKPQVHVIGITPLVENMPSGKAARPDDLVIAMNGKSIEINNTDAEGRLILADALCYAEKFYKPNIIISIATLTGSILAALGHSYAGLMTADADLQKQLWELGASTGDRVWPLPLDNDYKNANQSRLADVFNAGSHAYDAGSITAACFLSEFVNDARWVHLDIAGVVQNVPGISYYGNKNPTGAGIRLLTEFLMSYK